MEHNNILLKQKKYFRNAMFKNAHEKRTQKLETIQRSNY